MSQTTTDSLPIPKCGAQPFPGEVCCDRQTYHDGPHHGVFTHIGEHVWMSQGEMLREYHKSLIREAGRPRAETTDHQREISRVAAHAWRTRNPERVKAQRAAQLRVFRAVQGGHLVKPSACEQCGSSIRVEAAHSDYSKPLEVRWLCRRCHRAWDHAAPKTGSRTHDAID